MIISQRESIDKLRTLIRLFRQAWQAVDGLPLYTITKIEKRFVFGR